MSKRRIAVLALLALGAEPASEKANGPLGALATFLSDARRPGFDTRAPVPDRFRDTAFLVGLSRSEIEAKLGEPSGCKTLVREQTRVVISVSDVRCGQYTFAPMSQP